MNKKSAPTEQPTSYFDHLFGRRRPAWVYLATSVSLLLLPFVAAALDGALAEFLRSGEWRNFLLPPAIIVYIWLVCPSMARQGADAVRAVRTLVLLDDEDFQRLVADASRINPRHEWLALGAGLLIGIGSALASGFDLDAPWLRAYWFVSVAAMYGLLAWTIFIAAASTRLYTALHRQPLRIDLFDPTPFEPIGRQGLLLALVFIGGMALSFLITFRLENLSAPRFWAGYLILVSVTLLIFFLSMRSTHRALSEEKGRLLKSVQAQIIRSSQDLAGRVAQNQAPGELPGVINALAVYEARLQQTRTWPYNTPTLRALFVSVLLPLGSILARWILDSVLP